MALLLATLNASAYAEWTRVEHPSKAFVLYVENGAIVATDASSAKLWHLLDYAEPQSLDGRAFLSIKARDEYDCSRGMRRDLMHLWHVGNMADGTLLKAAYKPASWTAPAAGSVEETLMRMVCSKK
ncbi:MAG: hypothetical protein FJY60_10370 [Betaproteobacteria bacterium]|nr:hypothetical protein [Betaproteobacteria bacterium]